MIQSRILKKIEEALDRQVGKTTLALELTKTRPAIYLDLESRMDRERLREPELFPARHEEKLVILDKIHRAPELFQTLRGLAARPERGFYNAMEDIRPKRAFIRALRGGALAGLRRHRSHRPAGADRGNCVSKLMVSNYRAR